MVIKYLTLLAENPSDGYWLAKGVPLTEIEALENEIGRRFPKPYVEFLLLAGDRYPYDTDADTGFKYLRGKQKAAQHEFIQHNQRLEKPYWAFGDFECKQFYIFYWDEGENPPVYLTSPECADWDEEPLVVKKADSFSKFIEHQITSEIKSLDLISNYYIEESELYNSLKSVAESLNLLYVYKPETILSDSTTSITVTSSVTVTSPVNGNQLYFSHRSAEKFNETAKDKSYYKGRGELLLIIYHGADCILIPFLKELLRLYPRLSVFIDLDTPILNRDKVLALKTNNPFVELFPKTKWNQATYDDGPLILRHFRAWFREKIKRKWFG